MNANEVRNPDIQVEVIAAGSTLCSICFWVRGDIHEGFDVALALDSKVGVSSVRTCLQSALEALRDPNWVSVDELSALAGEESEGSPF